MWGIRIGTLYKLLGRTDDDSYHHMVDPKTDKILSCIVDLTMFWHRPLGNIDEKGPHVIHSKGMVKGIPDCSFELNFCEHFIYGKQNLVSFPNKAIREKDLLELVHSDVFRPVSLPSLGGSSYYVSLIDDFSRMIWIRGI